MLTKEDYKKIADNWKGTVYQLYDRYQVRFPMLLKHIEVFKGKNVLEVGCNAGLAGYHIAQVANSYIGVEAEKGYWQQALQTKEFIYNNNAEFLNMSIKSYMKRAIRDGIEISANACYLSYVLYHFSDKEVRMFEQFILPKLDVIVVQSRYENRNKKGRTAHNSYKFWKPENVEKYLNKNGFSTTVEYGPRNKFHFVVGRKAYSDEEVLKQEDEMIREALLEPVEEKTMPPFGGEYDEYLKNELRKTNEETTDGDKEISDECSEQLLTGDSDGDQRGSGIHTEGQGKATGRRGTRGRKRRMAEGISCDNTGREADPQGQGGDVRAEDGKDWIKDILLPGVEESTTEEVCNKDIQEVVKAPRRRRRTKTVENSDSEDKPTI